MKRPERDNEIYDYRILDWDSKLFGLTVARILPDKLELTHLKNILASLKERDVSLAYWATDSTDENSQKAAKSLNGFFVDRKTTYTVNLKEMGRKELELPTPVETYNEIEPNAELENLALQGGEYSRFNIDPKISRKHFETLYKLWIRKSTNKTLADVVLLVRETNKIVGMITLGEKDGRGHIGLFAVDADRRGKKFGVALVRAAQSWFISKGYMIGQVVTQGKAIAACKLYKKCGYTIEKIENFYHFWL